MKLLAYLFTACLLGSVLWNCTSGKKDEKTQVTGHTSIKEVKIINPIITDKFTADPAALVHNNTVFLYAGHDEAPDDFNFYRMNEWLVYSSTDMVNWKEHPVPLKTTDFEWAKGDAWAAQVIERNGKFYWYVTVEHGSIPGKAIGVAVADSPVGPFTDALGKALITNDMTTDKTAITWDDIDPTVYIDDDGQAYLYWGNTACYWAKLKDNMMELDGEIHTVDLPNFTEAPWIHKRGDWYYLSYAYQFPEKTAYAMSKSITGPWEYKGILNELAGNSNTNHQAIIEFNDQWYFIYHTGGIQPNGGSFRRSVCIDELHYNPDGTMKRVIMTSEGIQ
ncbi:glycoside hydrolase family 43 protein [Draconibacterium orientale]|uniref:glycoside hydrolase family 43 protein n=1 Tax=Draconibacterium orientale TaxID=1168034 RepID=UPI002A0A782D|nr:glycoside hydrolase family 43 protein [Draconibacterium orientale]